LLAIRSDEELNQLLTSKVIVPSGGVLPNVHSVLLQKKKRKYKKKKGEDGEEALEN